MTEGIKRQTVHGLLWSLSEKVGQQGIKFAFSIALARLLLPEDFGLIAMLLLFSSIAAQVVDSGLGVALIQKKNTTYLEECSVFYFSLFLGFVLACALYLISPWIAHFYDKPLLIPLTKVLSLNLIVNAFGVIQNAKLIKAIDFKTQMKASTISAILSGALGVSMAVLGYGVWSLVAYTLSGSFFRITLLWLYQSWRPALQFSFDSVRKLYAFGSKILYSYILESFFSNIQFFVIGKFYSPADLGFFSRAKSWENLTVVNLSLVVGRVAFPVFARFQDDKKRLKQGLRMALTHLAMLSFPLMFGIAVVAEPLVLVVLTEKWLPSVPYLQLLCLGASVYPLKNTNLNVLNAQGRSDLVLRIEIISKILIALSIAITYRWGIIPIICGSVIATFLGYIVSVFYVERMLSYSFSEQLRDILPSVIFASIMGLVIYTIQIIQFPGPTLLLLSQVFIGILCYTVLSCFFQSSSIIRIIDEVCPRATKYLRAG